MQHTFSLYGKYEIMLASEVDGFITRPGEPPTIFLNDVMCDGIDFLDTCLHEALHVIRPELSEKRVNQVAGCVARALWRRGVRRDKQPSTSLSLWTGLHEGLRRTRPKVTHESSAVYDLACWLRHMGYDA